MLYLIIILGFILRIISLDQSLWLDEAINVLATQKFSFLGMVTEYAKADFHPPLFFAILWIWTKIFGIGEVFVRIPSVIFGTLTIYLVYLLGQKIHSKTLGLISALLLAINPLHIYYSQEARMYALATLAVVLNFLLLIKLQKEERVKLFFLIISNLFVLSSDYVAYLIFPAQLIFLLLLKQRKIIIVWFKGFSLAILLGLWWLSVFLTQLDIGAVASDKLPAWRFIVGGFDIKAIPLTFIKFIIGRISYPDKLIYASILLPIVILFSYLLLRGVRFINAIGKKILIFWLFVPLILGILISFIIPIYSYFRMLFTLPSFIILAALGILTFKSKLRYLFLIAVVLIEIFSSAIYLFNSHYQREDWRGLVNFVKSKNILVLFESSGTLPSFDYYAKGEINTKGGLKDFPAKDKNDVADLENISTNLQELYLVDYLVQISDPNRLVAKKLDQLGYKIVGTKDFPGIGFIYHYAK